MKYRKKPVVIEAIKFVGVNVTEVELFCGEGNFVGYTLTIPTLEGDMHVSIGDYLIKGIQGEFYPCKPDIFEATYELVDEND